MNEQLYPKQYLYRRIVLGKVFIDEHYAGNIDVGCISDRACFSKFHFIRLFKRVYGRTPHQYLSHVRIERAKQLLGEGVPVTGVCFAVGFESPGSFAALFKRTVGLTPSAYQLRQRRLKTEVSRAPLKFIPGCFSGKAGSA